MVALILLIGCGFFSSGTYADEFVRIRNNWKDNQFIYVEEGNIICGSIEKGCWGAQWILEQVDENYYRIKNRWKGDRYIHVEKGILECRLIEEVWWSAQWTFQSLSNQE